MDKRGGRGKPKEAEATKHPRRLTFEPELTADELIVSTFSKKDLSAPLFPQLRPPVAVDLGQGDARSQSRPSSPHRRAVPSPGPSRPSTAQRWFPKPTGTPAFGEPVVASIPDTSVFAREASARATSRSVHLSEVKNEPIPPYLQQIVAVFGMHVDAKGRLNKRGLDAALQELGVDTVLLGERHRAAYSSEHPEAMLSSISRRGDTGLTGGALLLNFLDFAKDESIPLFLLCQTFVHMFTQPEHAHTLLHRAFTLLDHSGQGYIHKSYIERMKLFRSTLECDVIVSTGMIKAVCDIFASVLKQEEDRYVSVVILKGKKKKAPPMRFNQNSHIPLTFMRKSHLSFDMFKAGVMASSDALTAFLGVFLDVLFGDQQLKFEVQQHMFQRAGLQDEVGSAGTSPVQAGNSPVPT